MKNYFTNRNIFSLVILYVLALYSNRAHTFGDSIFISLASPLMAVVIGFVIASVLWIFNRKKPLSDRFKMGLTIIVIIMALGILASQGQKI
jgi:membrane protease YdiL (CAAX protease family)